jgi:hypothetical protein
VKAEFLLWQIAAPLNRIITNILKLQNKSDKDFIAYKVKTTRPQRYCVRPNIGVIPPGETIELQSTTPSKAICVL